ncbi:hypothetical protein JCM11251_000894 [Rhodosporidiobolus azoricus]
MASSLAARQTSPTSVQPRRRSLAFQRDLFANGEREAVRCRPSTIYLPLDPAEDYDGRDGEGRSRGSVGCKGEEQQAERSEEMGWREFLSSSSCSSAAPTRRRSSIQYSHRPPGPLPVPPLPPAHTTAFTFSPCLAQSSSQPRRHSEQMVYSRPPRCPTLLSTSASAISAPSPPLVDLLASTPALVYSSQLSCSTSSSLSSTRRQPRSHSLPDSTPLRIARPSASPTKLKRKPVPVFNLEDELEVVEDPKWDGQTPPLVPLVRAPLISPANPAKVDLFGGYGFPPASAMVQKVAETGKRVNEEMVKMAVDEMDEVASGLEERVRRMSLEATETGATGLGLGLRPVSPPSLAPGVDVKRKTLAEVKAEKFQERERGRRRSEDAARVVERRAEGTGLRERRRTEGSLGIKALSVNTALQTPPLSPTYSSSHGSSTSGVASRPTSATTTTSTLSSTSPSVTACSSCSASGPSKRPTFRPFALLKQQRSRPLPVHGVRIPPSSSTRNTFLNSNTDEELVDAWMDVIIGGDRQGEQMDEKDNLHIPFAAPSAFTVRSSPVALPPPGSSLAPATPAIAAEPSSTTWTGLGVYGADTVADLASSLPPLVYGCVAAAPIKEDAQMQGGSDTIDECIDASKGRPSFDILSGGNHIDMPASAIGRPKLTPSASSAFLNLPTPHRLNKRSASASFLDKTTSPPPVFSSAPASPSFTAAFSAIFRPTPSASRTPAATAVPAPPISPIAPPAAKRQHFSSSLSPPFPPAPSSPSGMLRSAGKVAPSTAPGTKNKPLPARPPRPPKSVRRSLGAGAGGAGRDVGEIRRRRSAERMRESAAAMGRAERELASCPVL